MPYRHSLLAASHNTKNCHHILVLHQHTSVQCLEESYRCALGSRYRLQILGVLIWDLCITCSMLWPCACLCCITPRLNPCTRFPEVNDAWAWYLCSRLPNKDDDIEASSNPVPESTAKYCLNYLMDWSRAWDLVHICLLISDHWYHWPKSMYSQLLWNT